MSFVDEVLRRTSGSACPAARVHLPALAGGSLARPDRALVRAHLAGCAACRAVFATYPRTSLWRRWALRPRFAFEVAYVAVAALCVVVTVGDVDLRAFSGKVHTLMTDLRQELP